MKRLVVTIPRPPSVNALFRNVPGKGRVRTGTYNVWAREAGYALNRQTAQAGTITGPVSVSMTLNKGRGDLANFEKAATDLLVKHRLLQDDDQVIELMLIHAEEMGRDMRIVVEAKVAAA